MPSNPQDTVGTQFANLSQMQGNPLSQLGSLGSQAATTGFITTTNTNQAASYTPGQYYNGTYYWPYYYPQESRVVALEAEVRVHREMVAAMVSGRSTPKPKAAKARKTTKRAR